MEPIYKIYQELLETTSLPIRNTEWNNEEKNIHKSPNKNRELTVWAFRFTYSHTYWQWWQSKMLQQNARKTQRMKQAHRKNTNIYMNKINTQIAHGRLAHGPQDPKKCKRRQWNETSRVNQTIFPYFFASYFIFSLLVVVVVCYQHFLLVRLASLLTQKSNEKKTLVKSVYECFIGIIELFYCSLVCIHLNAIFCNVFFSSSSSSSSSYFSFNRVLCVCVCFVRSSHKHVSTGMKNG